jgi:hypothetical protein
VRDQMDMLPIPAIDGAQHALAEPRRVLDDPVEHRLDAGRRVRDEAQDLVGRGLPLPGFLKFEGKPFGLGLGGTFHFVFCGAGDAPFWRLAALCRGRRVASRSGWSVACLHCLSQASG